MPSISSNTIVKNGMPYIGKVLEQVAPYMEKMIVHLSVKSDDGTVEELKRIYDLFPNKLIIYPENVSKPGDLTAVRNEQVSKTNSDWILFLDDDDYWPKDQLELCLAELDKDKEVLSYSVNPYQLIDFKTHDKSWEGKKFFAKFLRKRGLRYIGDWPKDMPCDEWGKMVYWKTHPQARTLPYRFYHLALIKGHSFRSEEWANNYIYKQGQAVKLDKPLVI